jgi:AcrR family transcriptional regulator
MAGMSPAKLKIDDAALLAATARAIARLGPGRATVRAIAAEAGLSPGRVVQRFGSKRALLLAVTAQGADATRALFERLRARHASPLGAIRAYADTLARTGDSPDTLTHYLSLLQLEQTDPEFRENAVRDATAVRNELRALVAAAAAAGELRADAVADGGDMLARRIHVTLGGSLLAWATLRQGTARAWVRDDVDALLEPFERRGGR